MVEADLQARLSELTDFMTLGEINIGIDCLMRKTGPTTGRNTMSQLVSLMTSDHRAILDDHEAAAGEK